MDETLNKRRKPFLQISSVKECFGFLKNTLFPSNQTTALEITSKYLRLIQFGKTPEKKPLIRRILQYPLQDQEPEKIKTLLQEYQIDRLITFIPRHFVTQKYLIVPATDLVEIQQMTPFQIPDLTPHSRDEITFDYQVISKDEEGCSRLMAVIVQNKVLEDYFSRINEFGLRPDAIQLSSAALANWFFATYQEEPPVEADKIYTLVYLDEESLDVAYIQGKQLISSRGAELKASLNSEKTFNQVAWELKQGLAIINQELGPREIGKIILAGQSLSPELASFLSEDLSVLVEQAAAPFKDITFAKPFPENKEELESDYSLIRLLGLGLAETVPTPIIFNLLPLPAKKEKEIYSRKKLYLRNVILGVFVFFLLLFNFSFKIYKEAREIKVLSKKVKSIEPLAKRVDLERKTLQLIKEEFNSGPSSLNILEELYKITPETIALSSLDLEIGKVAILRGQAQELSQVFDYVTTVEHSPYLQNVKVNYANRRKIGEDETVSFEFYCHLTPSAGEKEAK